MHHDCGVPWSVSMDPANAEKFTVDVLGSCAACYALAAKADRDPPGPMYRVRLRDET